MRSPAPNCSGTGLGVRTVSENLVVQALDQAHERVGVLPAPIVRAGAHSLPKRLVAIGKVFQEQASFLHTDAPLVLTPTSAREHQLAKHIVLGGNVQGEPRNECQPDADISVFSITKQF